MPEHANEKVQQYEHTLFIFLLHSITNQTSDTMAAAGLKKASDGQSTFQCLRLDSSNLLPVINFHPRLIIRMVVQQHKPKNQITHMDAFTVSYEDDPRHASRRNVALRHQVHGLALRNHHGTMVS